MAEKKEVGKAQAIGSVLALAALGWYFFGGGVEHEAAKEMTKIEDQVANDSVTQYQIAKRNGNATDVCVAAGMVTAAYLQAKDEANYAAWKKTQSSDCAAASMPTM